MDRIDYDLNKYYQAQESAEEMHQELYELAECRTFEICDELQKLISEMEGFNYGIDCKDIVLEIIKNNI